MGSRCGEGKGTWWCVESASNALAVRTRRTSASSSVRRRTKVAIPSSVCFRWGPRGRMWMSWNPGAQALRVPFHVLFLREMSTPFFCVFFPGTLEWCVEVPPVLLRNSSLAPSCGPQPAQLSQGLGVSKGNLQAIPRPFHRKRLAALRIRIKFTPLPPPV